ncbi:hypothetical protein P5808_24925 [Bacillus cereus]|uniref:hypothetical protein n=1 Tax=Bacillus cereus TaxID=1396 RepID=UPI002404B4CD|nr:hypothetical protein [Bacillus cereus]MDF9504265.1 hypothetical protein [Bacillus cereus]MDF9597217.1 hypothetical protein [Bacillus cereus]MDF9609043.1 hypothetical protein [Bacillus cereus]MDF9660257.1 hypothetical protein [Bacillus cereus]
MSHEVSTLLTRYYVKLGMTAEEYIVLNSYLNHSKIDYRQQDLNEIAEMTNKTLDEVTSNLQSLFDKGIISKDPIHHTIDILKLHLKLISVQNDSISLHSLITKSMRNYQCSHTKHNMQHFGQVTLLPLIEGGIAITQGTRYIHGELMWTKQHMQKLSHELSYFLDKTDQEWINKYNKKIRNSNLPTTQTKLHYPNE